MTSDEPPSPYFAAREQLLRGELSNKELGLREVRQAGWALAGDPNDLSIFGMPPPLWYLCGVRIVGRTAVELTRDPHARFFGRSVAEALAPLVQISDVVDPFVGSGNLLFHVGRALRARRIIGLDAAEAVAIRTERNFRRVQRLGMFRRSEIAITQQDWSEAASYFRRRPTLFILSPPWGDAYSERGLDLGRTTPPVLQVLQTLAERVGCAPVFALVQTDPLVIQESVNVILHHFTALARKKSSDPNIVNRVDYLLLKLSE